MGGEANIWNPRTLIEISADTKSVEEKLTAIAGQTLFTLIDFIYVVGTGALEIHKNGLLLTKGTDWVEQTSTTFSLTAPALVGDTVVASGHVGITGIVDPRDTDIYVSNYQAIRDYAGTEITLYSQGRVTSADTGEAFFQKKTGAAPGFYVDNNIDTIVPTGGNGSIGWIRKLDSAITYTTLTAALADTFQAKLGVDFSVGDYATGNNSGELFFKWVAAATGTVDGGSYLDHDTLPLQAQQKFSSDITVKMFGAIGDGVTDDTAKFQAALNFSSGKVLVVRGTSGYLIDSNLSVGNRKSLVGDYSFIDPRNGAEFGNYGSRIILNGAASITLHDAANLEGLPILRKGLIIPADAVEVSQFTGTAIKTAANTHGQFIGYSAIVGFDKAIETDPATNTEQIRCSYLNIDCKNGIIVDQCFDVAYIDNCHCWPTASIGLVGVVDADLQRPGTAFTFSNGGDWNRWTNCFSFGYNRGFVIDTCNSCTIDKCGADYTSSQTANPIGFEVIGDSADTRLSECQAAGQNIGYHINSTSVLNHVSMVSCNSWDADANHVLNTSGELYMVACRFRGGTANGVSVIAQFLTSITDTSFENIGGAGITSTSTLNVLRLSGVAFTNFAGAKVVNPYLPSLVSADPLTLNGTDTVFEVTGNTNIGNILHPADYSGKTITLVFTGTLSVNDGGANLILSGTFSATPTDTITLMSDGAAWYEVSRSVN